MNKVAIITGSTSGIGKATAITFGRSGYSVVVTGRNEARGAAVCREIINSGGDAAFIAADLTVRSDAERLVAHAAELGELAVLVNNAGGNNGQPLEREMATNFFSAVYCTEAAIAKMPKGCIIYVASICGCSTVCNDIVYYSAAKAAVVNYAKNMAKNLAPNIRVNTVLPGFTRTPDWGELDGATEKRFAQKVPISRFIEPEEIAEAIFHLASNAAITGTALTVDGGLTLQ